MKALAKSWMTGDPVSIMPDASAAEALELMVGHGIRHLPVVDAAHRLVGILSVDDLRAALPFPLSSRAAPSPGESEIAREWQVSDVMTYAPKTITEETELAEAAQTMADGRLGCLPVIDEQGRLAAILSETDVLHALATMLWTDQVRERRAEASELDLLVSDLRREREAIAQRLDVAITPSLDEMAARRLEAIDRGLDRAGQGRFGVCERCGGRIPVARLRALPGALECVACASE